MSNVTTSNDDSLRRLVDRIERLEAEKQDLSNDIKDMYTEAKAAGFDVKILRQVIRLRKVDSAKRKEDETILDLYMNALGMLADTPLGQAALDRVRAA